MLLVPMLMFYLLWPNWGTTLYGEVRGACDFKRVFSGMFFGLWTTVLLSVVLLLLFAKTFGFDFYQDANALWIDCAYGTAPRTRCRSSPTRCCWPAGWCTTRCSR